MIYNKEQVDSIHQHTFAYLNVEESGHVLTITLNRPHKKNALNPVMVNELAFSLSYAHHRPSIWVVVLQAKGDVFCAGADLGAFMGATESHQSTIPEPSGEVFLGDLFRRLHKPCIARVEGDVYAGGFLLLTGCTHVVACNDIKLGLPETKRGLFPFQVMAGLLEIMPARKVLDWCIRGYNLDVEHALEWGLVTQISIRETIEEDLQELLTDMLNNAPSAIRLGLEAYHQIRQLPGSDHHAYLKGMLVQALQTEDAREGMAAFREKRNPEWKGK